MIESVQPIAIANVQSQNLASKAFDRLIDTINPLHHIPVVGHIYRSLSGDDIAPESSFAGGFLYGGPLGAIGATASLIIGGVIGDNNDHPTPHNAFNAKSFRNAGGDTPRYPRIDMSDPWRFNR